MAPGCNTNRCRQQIGRCRQQIGPQGPTAGRRCQPVQILPSPQPSRARARYRFYNICPSAALPGSLRDHQRYVQSVPSILSLRCSAAGTVTALTVHLPSSFFLLPSPRRSRPSLARSSSPSVRCTRGTTRALGALTHFGTCPMDPPHSSLCLR